MGLEHWQVRLNLVVDPENGQPDNWDWRELLGLHTNETFEADSKFIESVPTCDICSRSQFDSPNVFNYGEATEDDWNGETGSHKYCETTSAPKLS